MPGAELPGITPQKQQDSLQYFQNEQIDANDAAKIGQSQDQKIATLLQRSPEIAKNPALINGLSLSMGLNDQTVAGAVNYMSFYGHMKDYVKQEAQGSQRSGNFFDNIVHGVRSVWDSAIGSIARGPSQPAKDISQGIKTGAKAVGQTAVDVTSKIPGIQTGNVSGAVSKSVASGVASGYNYLNTKTIQASDDALKAGKNVLIALRDAQMRSEQQQGANISQYGVLGGIVKSDEQQYVPAAKGAFQGAKDVVTVAAKVAERLGISFEELSTLGFVGPNGFTMNPGGNLEDLGATVGNAVRSVANLVNPFSKDNAYTLMAHTMAFYESMAARYGWSYAIGYATPSVIASIATEGAFSGTAIEAEDAALIMRVERAAANGEELPEDMLSKYEEALTRQGKARISDRAEKAQTVRGKGYSVSERVGGYVGKTLGAPAKIARAMGKSMQSVKMNAMYLTSQQTAKGSSSEYVRQLWEETKNGVAFDAAGRPMGTNGQMLASYFGIDKGNMLFSPVSGLTDFYTKFIGTDPLGAYGEVMANARSFDGFTGKLGYWFTGLGIRNPDDVYNAVNSYRRVQRAFKYMAEHSAAEIADAFRNTYADDTTKEFLKANSILVQLGEAKTVEQVARIHADLAESLAITRSMVPTMTMYELLKASLKGRLGDEFGVVGELLGSDAEFLQRISPEVMKQDGFPVGPMSPVTFIENDKSIRASNSFGRWLATRFTRAVMYIDDITGKVENQIINPGSPSAIPAIMDMLRSSLLPENVVKGVGDLLLRSKTPEDYINAYRQAVYHAVTRRVTAGMNKAEWTTFIHTTSEKVWEEIIRMTGHDGGGSGLFVNGIHGADLSPVITISDFGNKEIEKFAGIDSTHLGQLHFVRSSELRGLGEKMREFTMQLASTSIGREQFVRSLESNELRKLAEYEHATLDGIPEKLVDFAKNEVKKIRIPDEQKDGYREGHEKVQEYLTAAQSDSNQLKSEHFFNAYDQLRIASSKITRDMMDIRQQIIDAKNEDILDYWGIMGTGKAPGDKSAELALLENKMNSLKGQKTAFEDAIAELHPRIETVSIKEKEMREAIQAVEENRIDLMKLSNTLRYGDKTFEDSLDARVNLLYERLSGHYGRRSPYTMGWQLTVDNLNRMLSRTFVPLALLSGGWALRVSASEAILNTLRNGFWPSFDAKVARSIAKHEAYGVQRYDQLKNEFARQIAEDLSTRDKKFSPSEPNIQEAAIKRVKGGEVPDKFKDTERTLIRNVLAGALVGIEKGLISGMSEAERERMLDNFVGTIMRHDGHLPGGVHGTNETLYNENTVHRATGSRTLQTDEMGREYYSDVHRTPGVSTRTIGQPGYEESLQDGLKRISNGKLLGPMAKWLEERFYEVGLLEYFAGKASPAIEALPEDLRRQAIIEQGGVVFVKGKRVAMEGGVPRKIDLEGLREELEKVALQEIKNMSPDERARYVRDVARSKGGTQFARETAHEEWAAVLAEHLLSTVSGIGKNGFRFHGTLIYQAANPNRIRSIIELRREVAQMGISAPQHIVSLSGHNALAEGASEGFIPRVAEMGHDKLLAPIVNKLVREPLFLLEQHKQMELLQPLIESNYISEEVAQGLADERALRNMVKYVHNPKDKTLWEQNMRIAAPFYFAQNQAWRRAFRVMRDDPGAFEKYLKLSLGVTNYISTNSVNGTTPSIFIPGTQVIGPIGTYGTNMLSALTPGAEFSNLGFGLAADPGSVSSVFPTGPEGGIAGALGLLRPSWGPLVTIPTKLFERALGSKTSQQRIAQKWLAGLLGPISQNSTLFSDLLPNTEARNILEVGVAALGGLGVNNILTNAFDSSENYVINNAIDNMFASIYENVRNTTDFSGINANTGQKWNNDEIIAYCRAQADWKITDYFNKPHMAQEFLDHAKIAAVVMFGVKAALGAMSPVALSLQQTFSASPELNKLLESINPLTGRKYTSSEAAQEFVLKHPEKAFDLVAHSKSPYEPFPETVSANNWLTNFPQLAEQYPNASSFLIDRNSQYSPQAYTLEMSLQLRSKASPQEYLDALLVSAGDDYYYNFLAPLPEFGGNGVSAGKNISTAQYKALSNAARYYGTHENPTWLNDFSGGTRTSMKIKAVNEMTAMLADPKLPAGAIAPDEKIKFEALMKKYNETVSVVQGLKAVGEGTAAYNVEIAWKDWCEFEATNNPEWAKQSYFLTKVLASLPTK